jgi:Na+/H+ antiporter NhaD/arsenite permease-like protein
MAKKNNGKDFIIFILLIALFSSILFFLLGNWNQFIAGIIFITSILASLFFWRFRVGIVAIGLTLLILTGTIDIETSLKFMNFDVIIFLIGMMVLVAMLRDVGFFSWIGIRLNKFAKFNAKNLFVIILLLSAVMAALVDEVTSILFISTLIISICDQYKVNPVKYVISAVFATNIGSSWTVLGNPIGIIIAMRAGLTFEDFIRWAFPVGLASLLILVLLMLLILRNDIKTFQQNINKKIKSENSKSVDEIIETVDKTIDKKALKIGVTIFFSIIFLISIHARIEALLNLEKNTFLIIAPIAGAGVAMVWRREKAQKYVERVDWWNLVFFIFLFSIAGCISYVGLSDRMAISIANYSKSLPLMVILISLISAFASSVIDNVVLVTSFIPIISSLASSGINVFPLWWALLFGGCYGGNITQIGSTANIVALGVLEKRKHYYIKPKEWIPVGLVAGIIPAIIGLIFLLVQI